MLITSPAFNDGDLIPAKFTCDGGDINPELQIQNVPAAAKSLALVLHDPDAPVRNGFTHWIVWNIGPSTALIKQESVPPGSTEGRNDAGRNNYVGPCPPASPQLQRGDPAGTHHYHFQLYALDEKLDLPAETDKDGLEKAMAGHIVEQAELVGLYRR